MTVAGLTGRIRAALLGASAGEVAAEQPAGVRQLLDLVRFVQQMFQLHRQLRQLLGVLFGLLSRKRAAQLAQIEAEQIERNHLRGESFG